MLEQEVLSLAIGLICFLECILDMLIKVTIVLFYLTSKMGMKLELSLLCFKLMVLMLMDV